MMRSIPGSWFFVALCAIFSLASVAGLLFGDGQGDGPLLLFAVMWALVGAGTALYVRRS